MAVLLFIQETQIGKQFSKGNGEAGNDGFAV